VFVLVYGLPTCVVLIHRVQTSAAGASLKSNSSWMSVAATLTTALTLSSW